MARMVLMDMVHMVHMAIWIDKMTDIHSHILHGIDDGPKTCADSIELLKTLQDTGVQRAVATSHYYSAAESLESFVEAREVRMTELTGCLKDNGLEIEIIPGAEVHMDKLILNRKSIRDLCYNGGKYILLEISHADADSGKYTGIIEKIMSYYNVIPVIAHVERYLHFLKNIKNVEYLKDMGCMVQLDAECFFGSFWLKRFGYNLLKKGLADVIASDCHDIKLRAPNLHLAYDVIAEKMGQDAVDLLKYNADSVIE